MNLIANLSAGKPHWFMKLRLPSLIHSAQEVYLVLFWRHLLAADCKAPFCFLFFYLFKVERFFLKVERVNSNKFRWRNYALRAARTFIKIHLQDLLSKSGMIPDIIYDLCHIHSICCIMYITFRVRVS